MGEMEWGKWKGGNGMGEIEWGNGMGRKGGERKWSSKTSKEINSNSGCCVEHLVLWVPLC